MSKIKTSNIIMAVLIVLIFGYIIYEAYSVTHIELKTETAVISTVYEKIETKALVIRDEHPINKASSGVTVPALADGDKINVGGNVAMTFSSPEAAENYSKYAELMKQLNYYENLEAQTLGQAASVESINSEIDTKVDAYIRARENSPGRTLETAGENINDSILRRQMIIGEEVDLVTIIQDLRQKTEKYSSFAKPDGYIKTDSSGVFSSYTDGCEDEFDYTKAPEMTAEEVKAGIKKAEKSDNGDKYLGKLVTSYAWYLECVVDADAVRDLKNGSKMEIALKDNDDTVLTAQIVSGAEVEPQQKKTVLILKCSNLDSKLAALRTPDIEMRLRSYEGIKVPASALHMRDGKKGVYALVSSQVNFREAQVIYSADDYVILKFEPENPNGIRLYDKVITQGKELEDGKVFN